MRTIFPERPKVWDRRTVSGFLLFPKTIGREQRWLERATWEELYTPGNMFSPGLWDAVRWVDSAQPEREGRGNG